MWPLQLVRQLRSASCMVSVVTTNTLSPTLMPALARLCCGDGVVARQGHTRFYLRSRFCEAQTWPEWPRSSSPAPCPSSRCFELAWDSFNVRTNFQVSCSELPVQVTKLDLALQTKPIIIFLKWARACFLEVGVGIVKADFCLLLLADHLGHLFAMVLVLRPFTKAQRCACVRV